MSKLYPSPQGLDMPTYAIRLNSRERKQTGNTHKVEQVTWE